MNDTKERILTAALLLFGRDGYEAVSVSDIAGALGMTKGALYRHYTSKRHIFDSILLRMEQQDAVRAATYAVPGGTLAHMPAAYQATEAEALIAYAKAQVRYWTEDPFAAPFRRMLTLEQHRNSEMAQLYQQYLAAGPLTYVTDLLTSWGLPDAAERAAALYGTMFLLYTVYDASSDKAAVLALADACLEREGRMLAAKQG